MEETFLLRFTISFSLSVAPWKYFSVLLVCREFFPFGERIATLTGKMRVVRILSFRNCSIESHTSGGIMKRAAGNNRVSLVVSLSLVLFLILSIDANAFVLPDTG
jgi:hypothetical protein